MDYVMTHAPKIAPVFFTLLLTQFLPTYCISVLHKCLIKHRFIYIYIYRYIQLLCFTPHSSIFIRPNKAHVHLIVSLHWLLCAPAVWHAAAVSGWAEAGAVPRLPGPPDNEGHREHYHHRGGEPQWNLRELPWVWGRWGSCSHGNFPCLKWDLGQ